MTPQSTTAKPVNGVDVQELWKTIDAVKATPGIARFKFKISNRWLDGGYNQSTVGSFFGGGADNERPTQFVLEADEPPILLGQDLSLIHI